MVKYKNKKGKTTIFAIICILFILSAELFSCDADCCGGMLNKRFFANVEGIVDGKEVNAVVYCDTTEHKTKEIYNKITVTFNAPSSLEGIRVSLRSDGKATIRLRDTLEELPLYGDMITPFLALCLEEKPLSILKTKEGYEVIYDREGERLKCVFDNEGRIKSAFGKHFGHEISLEVTNLYEK